MYVIITNQKNFWIYWTMFFFRWFFTINLLLFASWYLSTIPSLLYNVKPLGLINMCAVVIMYYTLSSWYGFWIFKSCKDQFITASVFCVMLSLLYTIFSICIQASLDFLTQMFLSLKLNSNMESCSSWFTSYSSKYFFACSFAPYCIDKWKLFLNNSRLL